MPHVVNGIGTWYYGKRNVSVRRGQCPHCGGVHELTSYDTRTWLVLFFLPLIPLRRYRVVDECTGGRHHQVKLSLVEEQVEKQAAPLEPLWRAGDVAAGRELAKVLVRNERYDRAARHVRAFLAENPGDAEVTALLPAIEYAEDHAVRRSGRARIAGIAALVLLGVGATLAVRANETVRLVVDNRASAPAKLTLDGAPWLELAAGEWRKVEMPRGDHDVEAAAGARREKFHIRAEPSLGSNVFGSQTFVLDVFRLGVYVDWEAVYGAGTPRDAREHVAERFFAVPKVDDLFSDPPQSARVEKGSTKRRQVLERVPATGIEHIGRRLLAHERAADAVEVLEAGIEDGGASERAVDLLLQAGKATEKGEAVEAWIAAHRSSDPRTLALHRAYQNPFLVRGETAALAAEYDRFLAANPGSAMAQYLRGRLEDGEPAMARFRRGIELDPRFPWCHVGLGYELLGARRFEEGAREYREAGRLAPAADAAALRERVWNAMACARIWDSLERELEVASAPDADAGGARDLRALYLLARTRIGSGRAKDGEWDRWLAAEAKELVKDERWRLSLELERLRWRGDAAAAGKLVEPYEKAGGDAGDLYSVRFGLALATGDAGAAENLLSERFGGDGGARPTTFAILYAIRAEWAGAKDRAAAWLIRLREGTLDDEDEGLVAFLRGERGAHALAAADRSPDFGTRSAAALARALRAADAKARADELDLAVRLGAYDMSEPALLARALIERR